MKNFKLGKQEFKEDKRDFKFSKYADKTVLPTPPASTNHRNNIGSWGMLANDEYGDCVIAGGAHETMLWTKEGYNLASAFSDSNVLADYHAFCGAGDNGCDVRTVLGSRQKTGLKDGSGTRHKIGAYLALDLKNHDEVKLAVYLFSAVGIGFNFPDYAMTEFNSGQPWDVKSGGTIEGGHYVPVIDYDSNYLYVVTWGKIQKMTWAFYDKYCDEAWAMLSQEMLGNDNLSPEGFDITTLQNDLNNLKSGGSTSNTPNVAQALIDANLALSSSSSSVKNTYIKKVISDLGG